MYGAANSSIQPKPTHCGFDLFYLAFTGFLILAIVLDCYLWFPWSSEALRQTGLAILAFGALILLAWPKETPTTAPIWGETHRRFTQDLGVYALITFMLTLIGMRFHPEIAGDYRSVSLLTVAGLAFAQKGALRAPIPIAFLIAAILVGNAQYLYGNENVSLFLCIVGLFPFTSRRKSIEQQAIITAATIILGYITFNVSLAVASTLAAVLCRASPITIGIRVVATVLLYLSSTPMLNPELALRFGAAHVFTHERSDVWLSAIRCWIEAPILGSPSCPVESRIGGVYVHFHNTALTALAFNGVIGCISTLWFAWRIWLFGASVNLHEFTLVILTWCMLDEPLFFCSVGALFVLLLLDHPAPSSTTRTP